MVASYIPAPPSREYLAARGIISEVLNMMSHAQILALAETLKAASVSLFEDMILNGNAAAKCPSCGVRYVEGARHFSGCPLHPGKPVDASGE